ncbi:MAG: 1-(5-phosphoribosyl)-5-[(5-phosphoribosylamino)methylideneamino]imidazole-4-carboxamide isomerase [Elusimicrobia bacterium]|nr:1-(5-phosphoribosyl)-5-[(5-phosphoribosylamino)methylideneamino]imidazole-4-carboxamide isomerase [Elusimicrobiota bacterium]
MLIIPAVDIMNGNCVRLTQGSPSAGTVYSREPLIVAKLWQAQGAQRLHVVDLDGAFSGKIVNRKIILRITKELDIPVQVGGGIRDYDTIRDLLNNGVDKVIMGTSAIYDTELLKSAVKKWKKRIIVGIDSSSGKVAVGGWQSITDKSAVSLAAEIEGMGISQIIVTDIKKDGTLKGPNCKWIKKIAETVKIPVIASGGISSIDDIVRLKELKLKNLAGVIVGKALYRDDVLLPAAIEAAR